MEKAYGDEAEAHAIDLVEHFANAETVLGTETDPKLPPAAVDLIFILDAYHHFNYPEQSLAHLQKALKPDGRLAIIDFYRSRKHPRMSPERRQNHIRLDRDGFASEIAAAGFRLERKFDHLPYQYVLIFKKDHPHQAAQAAGN